MTFYAVSLISVFIWLLPPLRQYKNYFFYYFVILAFSDVISIAIHYSLGISVYSFYVTISVLSLLSLLDKEHILRWVWYYSICAVLIIVTSFCLEFNYFSTSYFLSNEIIFVFLHSIILTRIIYLFVLNITKAKAFNLFYIVLMLYELSIIVKFLNLLTGLTDVYTYFYITSIFQAIIGLFFSIFREDNRRIIFQFK